MADTTKTTRSGASRNAGGGFTAEEKAAMRERARESKADASREAGERDVLAKIAEMTAPERAIAERIHAIVAACAPALAPRTWYGMPAYAKDGKVLCFFQAADKFKSRYSTFGFTDEADLDDGEMWPTGFVVMELTAEVERRIEALVRQAIG